MKSARLRTRILDARGMTWVTAVLLLALGLGGYLLWVWVPVYWLHYEAKQVVRDVGNLAVKNPNDRELLEDMLTKLRALGTRPGEGPGGGATAVPVIEVAAKDVLWERTQNPPTLHVAFEYVREVRYPLLERSTETTLQVDVTMDISRPDWGTTR